jgi:hypothetical protein
VRARLSFCRSDPSLGRATKVMTLEYFMDYPDDPGKPESQTSYFKIAIYAERES